VEVCQEDYSGCIYLENENLCTHFYVKEINEDKLELLETDALRAKDRFEVLGTMRVPFYQLEDGKGFPTFIKQNFAGNALQNLLRVVQERDLYEKTAFEAAVEEASLNDLLEEIPLHVSEQAKSPSGLNVTALSGTEAPRWSPAGGPTLCLYSKQPIQAVAGAKIGMSRRIWTVTNVQAHYIASMTEKYDLETASDLLDGASWGITNLVKQANSEDTKTKKLIFRIVRCYNCQQGNPTGGEKVEMTLDLRPIHLKWLENVHQNCGHSSVDKTMRILLDFYMSYCKKDSDLEARLFDPNYVPVSKAPEEATKSVEIDNAELQQNLVTIYQEHDKAPSQSVAAC